MSGARQRGADGGFDVGRRRAPSAADAGDDHGFVQAHCVTGIAARQPVLSPTGSGARNRDADQFAAERGVAREQQRFGFERHRIDHEAAAGAQRRDGGVEHAGIAGAAADEDRVRRGKPGERGRRRAFDDLESRHAEGGGVAADARGAVGAPLDRDGAHRRIGQHPFDRDRARAGADVPQQFAAARRQRRQRHRADFALGDLAVVLEQIVGKAGAAREDARAGRGLDLDRDGIERVDRAEIEARPPSSLRMRSRGPPSASSTVRREAPKPVRARSRASAAGPSPSEVNARMRAPGCRCGRTRSSVRPCTESSTVCGNDQPSRAAARLKADGAGTTIISRASMCRASTAPTP